MIMKNFSYNNDTLACLEYSFIIECSLHCSKPSLFSFDFDSNLGIYKLPTVITRTINVYDHPIHLQPYDLLIGYSNKSRLEYTKNMRYENFLSFYCQFLMKMLRRGAETSK